MQRISAKTKESIILKAINRRPGTTLKSIAAANNIGKSTLAQWLGNYRKNPVTNGNKQSKVGGRANRAEQLNHLLESHNLDELSLGEYCRKQGLYSHQ